MLLSVWFTLYVCLFSNLFSALAIRVHNDTHSVEIKVGFLVGSKRLQPNQSYLQPGRQLLHVFHHAINKMNQLYSRSKLNSTVPTIRFVPVIAETFGDESLSIKQTIALITRQAVNFIVGPQETCQVESQLASIFNVAMISHYCSWRSPFNYKPIIDGRSGERPLMASPMTFIQTKPPHWKIVERVVTLVGQLLEAHNRYPQNLVLLYYKEPSSVGDAEGKASKYNRINLSVNSTARVRSVDSVSDRISKQQPQQHQPASDAIQYKLVGELLEIKLNELLVGWRQSAGGRINKSAEARGSAKRKQARLRPLAILNWHTTFHYGFTKNPFRQLIRRHLFKQQNAATTGTVTNQCDPSLYSIADATNHQKVTSTTTSTTINRSWSSNDRAAIYIVVGHYYEHLGLMMALNELDLFGSSAGSFPGSDRNQQSSNVAAINQQSVVVGVDTEEYDERDDSVRFLRGLLMDESEVDNREHHNLRSTTNSAGDTDQLDSVSIMYGHYLGIVPAKPTRMTELLDEIGQSLYNQTNSAFSDRLAPSNLVASKPMIQEATNVNNNNTGLSLTFEQPFQGIVMANQSTLDALQLTNRLLQFMRLPVDAFYLYDSIALLGAYVSECIQLERLSLDQCCDGRRTREWFKNREYTSFVNQNTTSFDSQAQTEGLYTLIAARRKQSSDVNQLLDSSESINDDEFGLVSIGQFSLMVDQDSDLTRHKIDIFADYDSIDPVWLPFWCIVRKSNISLCTNFSTAELQPSSEETAGVLPFIFILVLIMACFALATVYWLIGGFTLFRSATVNQVNLSWFNEQDERNFLRIIHSHLLTPEIANKSDDLNQDTDDELHKKKIMVELHCHMFPFPSCKFVHWLTALHQLKEMIFKYLASINEQKHFVGFEWLDYIHKRPINQTCANNSKGFFAHKHKGTNSLRLLLNKYKSINECFCCLSDLNHKSVVKLYGTTLLFNEFGKSVRLVIEQPDRGNLRYALRSLKAVLGEENEADQVESAEFMSLLIFSLVNDLLDGLEYLHTSKTGFHGELRATTCLLATNWRLKLSGFHSTHMRRSLGVYEQKNLSLDEESQQTYLNDLVYSAPEVLQNHHIHGMLDNDAMKLADIYSFAFVFYELLVGQEPWKCLTQVTNSRQLIDRVKVDSSFRPPLSHLDKSRELKQVASAASSCSSSSACSFNGQNLRWLDLDGVQSLMRSSWSHLPARRPQSVTTLRLGLLNCCLSSKIPFNGKKIHGQVMKCYAKLVESVSVNRKENLALERKRSKEFELKLLPESIVAKLGNNPSSQIARELLTCRRFEYVSFCSFKILIVPDDSRLEEMNFFEQLNEALDQLDKLVSFYQKRIHLLDSQVDSSMRFMVYAGEPLMASKSKNNSCREIFSNSELIASFALQLIDLSNRWQTNVNTTVDLRVRCGLHCGSAMGGLLCANHTANTNLINSRLARYVLFGSSMKLVNSFESSGLPQRIQISTDFRKQLIQSTSRESHQGFIESGTRQNYVMIKREGKIYAKNVGEFESYWLLNGPRLTASQSLLLSDAGDTNQSCA